MKPLMATCPSSCECNGDYVYKVGYGTCEESSFREFRSSKKLSAEELKGVVAECLLDAVMKSRPSCSCSVESYIPDNEHFVAAMKERGFLPLEYTAKFDMFGWCDLLVQNHWTKECDDEEKRFLSAISKKLSEKAWRVRLTKSKFSRHEYFFFAESEDELFRKVRKEFRIRNIRNVEIKKGIRTEDAPDRSSVLRLENGKLMSTRKSKNANKTKKSSRRLGR